MPFDPTTRTIEIECLRFNPETDTEPHLQTYKVPFHDDMSVLQGLQYIKDNLDGSLTFRWSCRMASPWRLSTWARRRGRRSC